MFGLQFLFAAALWALPLAGLPLILHLLFRQKSPLIPFSTLRFVQASVRQTAARKKIHRWLLLACRAILIALLIWALAQPARRLATGLLSGGSSLAAAIVVDSSYSMLLRDQQSTLLQEADADVQDLLRTELRDANVAIFRGSPPSSLPRLAPAVTYRGDRWEALAPTANNGPLVDQVATAADLLTQSGADRKELIILTDAQAKEFPHPLPHLPDIQTLLIDLHPPDVRAAAVTAVTSEPTRPRLGIPARIAIEALGRPGDVRDLKLDIAPADQHDHFLPTPPLPLAHFDDTGRAQLRTPLIFSDSSALLVTARLTSPEPLAWATSRTQLVQIPPRQSASILTIGPVNPLTVKLIRLALDPSEGARPAWPIDVRNGDPHWTESLIVALLNRWPSLATAQHLQSFVRSGGSLVLFLQPGLETSWNSLDPPAQAAIKTLLPSSPLTDPPPDAAYHASIVRPSDPILADIGDPAAAEGRLTLTRLIRFTPPPPPTQSIINAAPTDPDSRAKLTGLLFRKPLGAGVIYIWATVPDRSSGNLHVWDLFPPTLVNAAAAGSPSAQLSAQTLNVQINQPLLLPATFVPAGTEVDITPPPPNPKPIHVPLTGDHYRFDATTSPGLYTWQWRGPRGQAGLLAYANVQLPADEAELQYRPLPEITAGSPAVLTGHSLQELRQRLTQLDEPSPQWTLPIALVLLLLCLEALLGATPRTARLPSSRNQPITIK